MFVLVAEQQVNLISSLYTQSFLGDKKVEIPSIKTEPLKITSTTFGVKILDFKR